MPDLDFTRQTRRNFTGLVSGLSTEEANFIPETFHNNIIWNYAHCIVTQQLLTYNLAGLELPLPQSVVDAFRKGSRPEKRYTATEIEQFKDWSTATIEQFEADVKAGKFQSFKEYPTSYGLTLHTLDEAIAFNNMHEALHLGYAMSMRKLVL